MQIILIPYGKEQVELIFPDDIQADIILPVESKPLSDEQSLVSEAITFPIGDFSWEKIKPVGRVCIAINDKTRPVPNNILVPPILAKLKSIGFTPSQIEFMIATGTHTPMRSDEFNLLLPQKIIDNYSVSSHDCDDINSLIYLGKTSLNTPIWVNKNFYDADLKIVIGNIEPHHFMGYSGGAKTAAIGLAGRETINFNHAMLVNPESTFGRYFENPTRLDVEEIGDFIQIDIALNIVMNQSKRIMHSLLGSPREVMLLGIPFSQKICQTEISHAGYDLVIASPGGYPKDINLYQAQKALSHAASITRAGGCVILVAACAEGVGSNSYELFMEGVPSPAEVFPKIQKEGFKVGPHKALQFAREQQRIKIIVVSSIDAKRLERLFLTSIANLDAALIEALSFLPATPRIAVMPKATNTIPFIKNHVNS
ncbi:MAG: nickel-dependent lactate racemase [Leptolinea sp.]